MNIITRIKNKLNRYCRRSINSKNRKKLKNRDFSLIASNCNGGFLLHDLGMRFNSPFINLWIGCRDFLDIISDLKGYMSEELTFVKEDGIDYPIGCIRGARIYFKHYQTEEEARQKWNERKARINYDNLFVMFTDRDNCTHEDMQYFDSLPLEHKIIFTNKKYPDIKSAVYISGFDDKPEVGNCFEFTQKHLGEKYYDRFDYISWFNSNQNSKQS